MKYCMTKDKAKIMIGCPVQEKREWIIPYYLEHLKCFEYPKKLLHPAFLYNYPSGGKGEGRVLEMLLDYKDKYGSEYHDFTLVEVEGEGGYEDKRTNHRNFTYFSVIRNAWMDLINNEDTHLFSIDSDVLMPPHSIRHLLKWDLDVVSAVIYNGAAPDGDKSYNFMLKLIDKRPNGDYVYYHRPPAYLEANAKWEKGKDGFYHITRPAQVGMTGACYLFKRAVYDAGVRYGHHMQGEDLYWSERAIENGFKLYCDATLNPPHILHPYQMNQLLKLPKGVSVVPPTRDQHLMEDKIDPTLRTVKEY